MAGFYAFRATRYACDGEELSRKLCPPYDIISPSEREELVNRDKDNFVTVELPSGSDPYGSAAKNLEDMLSRGVLKRDADPAFYIYEEEFTVRGETKKIRGIIGELKLAEFSEGVVLPHEETLSKAKEDRFRLLEATRTNTSLIYSMFDDPRGDVEAALNGICAGEPDQRAPGDDGTVHRLWVSRDPGTNAAITRLFEDKKLYIADGHHRYETALNYRRAMVAKGADPETDPCGRVMMFVIDIRHEGLVVFPTHRMVRDIPGFDPEALLEKISRDFEISVCSPEKLEEAVGADRSRRRIGFYAGRGLCRVLTLKDESATDPVPDHCAAYKGLDVTALHYLILERHLGIDKSNMASQKNLIYTRDVGEAVRGVVAGKINCAFILNPTLISQIADVALAGDKMPQKSTYFYPKLVTGLVMRQLEDRKEK